MAKRFSGDVGDFKPKKPKKLRDYKESSRFSFKLAGGPPKPGNDCGDINVSTPNRGGGIGDSSPFNDPGRKDGAVVNYSPDQLQNYTKSYPRFERALGLITDSAEYSSQSAEFLFCSDNSSNGYWSVNIVSTAPDYFVDAGRNLLILCPTPYRITSVTTNSELLIWTQLEGGRLAMVDTEEDSIRPELIILDELRSPAPIRFEIVADEDSDARDILTIYTTPTSPESISSIDNFKGLPDASPSREIPAFYAPLPKLRASVGGSLSTGFTWSVPASETAFITRYIVQQNIGGVYTQVATYGANDFRSYDFQVNQQYRILIERDTFGYPSVSDSFRIYFQNIPPIASIKDIEAIGSVSGTLSRSVTLPLDRAVFFAVDSNPVQSAISSLSSRSVTLPLGAAKFIPVDEQGVLASISGLKTIINKVDLGGVVIS